MPNSNNALIQAQRWFAIAFTGLFAFFLVGCTTSELDENERALVAKQQLADKFDQLFNLAFESPDKAEEQFNQLVFSDLVTDDHNLLADDDVRALVPRLRRPRGLFGHDGDGDIAGVLKEAGQTLGVVHIHLASERANCIRKREFYS